MHISVMPFFNKMRMLGKIIFPAVFQDKVPLAAQDGLFSVKNLVRNCVQAFQLIWWICKYEVKSTVAELQEVEHVAVDRPDFFQAEAFVHLAYKGGVFPVHFHAYSFTSSSGDEFSAYASCPSAIYYMLEILRKSQINPQQTTLHFSGKADDKELKTLRSYVKDVRLRM